MSAKTEQLQIRVSKSEKREIQRRARSAQQSVSAWILARVVPGQGVIFSELCAQLKTASQSLALAALNDFLAKLKSHELLAATESAPRSLSQFQLSYVAAMIEHTAALLGCQVPEWVLQTGPLPAPYFATALKSLRLHLLVHSPPAFRRRNLFVDATVGDRV